jgi:hypothetical protein
MAEFFNYKIITVGTEKVRDVIDAITEIRFFHVYNRDGLAIEKLYVAHIKYDETDKPVSYLMFEQKGKKKSILLPYIIKALGEEQIKHMENIIKEEFDKQHNSETSEAKKYISL